MHFSKLLLGGGLAPLAMAAYVLQDDYSGNNFFNMFTFDTEDDPTHGYVNYVDQGTAQGQGLIGVNNGVVTIKSDSTNVASGRGRNSVRVTSKKQYTHGLVILDLEHMPGAACGIWPAFWMTGPNWPNSGEIDIIEGVSYQSQNTMTLHTGPGCTMVNKNCQGNQGCSITTGDANSYGDSFNQAKGGVYVMEWTYANINIWFFPRGQVPADIGTGTPNPLKWKWPTAQFLGGDNCKVDDHFMNNNIVFDTTFCGDWAGGVWAQTPQCSSRAPSCQAFVQNNPSAFNEAYWTINSLKVYSWSANTAKPAAAPPAAKPQAPAPQPQHIKPQTPAKPVTPAPAQSQPQQPDSGDHWAVQSSNGGTSWQETQQKQKQQQQQQQAQAQEHYAVQSSNGGTNWSLNPIASSKLKDRRSAHRGLKDLPSAEKIVNNGDADTAPAPVQKRSIADVLGNEDAVLKRVEERGNETTEEGEGPLVKRHRGLKDLPEEDKIQLSGQGVGKTIDKQAGEKPAAAGAGAASKRMRRHLARHVVAARS